MSFLRRFLGLKPPMMGGVIYWDIENMGIPRGLRGQEVIGKFKQLAQLHRTKLQSINVIGNLNKLPSELKLELEEGGVVLQQVSSQKYSAADLAIHLEIMKLTQFQKPPFTIYVVTSDTDFSKILSVLELLHYTVVLIHKSDHVSDSLLYSTKNRVCWNNLMTSEDMPQYLDLLSYFDRHGTDRMPLKKLLSDKTLNLRVAELFDYPLEEYLKEAERDRMIKFCVEDELMYVISIRTQKLMKPREENGILDVVNSLPGFVSKAMTNATKADILSTASPKKVNKVGIKKSVAQETFELENDKQTLIPSIGKLLPKSQPEMTKPTHTPSISKKLSIPQPDNAKLTQIPPISKKNSKPPIKEIKEESGMIIPNQMPKFAELRCIFVRLSKKELNSQVMIRDICFQTQFKSGGCGMKYKPYLKLAEQLGIVKLSDGGGGSLNVEILDWALNKKKS